MRRQHIVIGTDNTDIHCRTAADGGLVITGRRKAMREIPARHGRTVQALFGFAVYQVEIPAAAIAAFFDDARGHAFDCGV